MSNFRFEIATSRGGYDDDWRKPAGNDITVELFGRRWEWRIREFIKPIAKSKNDFKRLADQISYTYYVDYTQRRYGAYLFDGHLNVMYGNASDDSSEEQRWSCFVPWSAARFIRTSHYDRDGAKILLTHWDAEMRAKHGRFTWDLKRAEVEALDNRSVFAFADYDGEEILATCRVDEREWRIGTGIFKWLFYFRRPRIKKSLSLEFSEEVGREKGSWKGGTIGHGIDMEPGESVRHCWARYCDKYHLTPLDRSPLEIREIKLASDHRRAARRADAEKLEQEFKAMAARNV